MRLLILCSSLAFAASATTAGTLHAQAGMDHSRHEAVMAASSKALSGQDAFATIAAVVAQLEADSTTDWSKVDIGALRRHLQAMSDVTLHAAAAQVEVPGGARMDVTGTGRVIESIRSMLTAHAPELEALGVYRAAVETIPNGARLTVRAASPNDEKTVAKIRALGFIGLLTQGAHHADHHVMIARGAHTHR